MAADDFAIVVGITRYPWIQPLQGPEFDAKQFYDWLVDPAKGNVLPGNVVPVLTSGYAAVNNGAEPTMEQVEEKFEVLRDLVKAHINKEGEQARRLYIFLAGHGLSWGVNSAALLTANANYDRRRTYHVAGREMAEWFRNAGYFREIVLLMDCCRTEHPNTPPRIPWPPESDSIKADVHYFYGFATKGGYEARERAILEGGPVRGLFTAALLEGLEHADGDEQGRLLGRKLSDYIYAKLPVLAGPALKQEPHIEVFPSHAFVWAAKPKPQKTRVRIEVDPPEAVSVVVEDPSLEEIGTFLADRPIQLNLYNGSHNLRCPARGWELGFDVVGSTALVRVLVSPNAAQPEERVRYVHDDS